MLAAGDPRHRLVTTKYNPPNAVGIGGPCLCV